MMESIVKGQLKIGVFFMVIAMIIGLCHECSAQDKDAAIQRRLREISAEAYGPYTTEFNGMNLNFVNARVQNFISQELKLVMVEDSNKSEMKDSVSVITEEYHKSIRANEKDHRLKVIYIVKPEGNNFIIKSCKVSGHAPFVINFFIQFWSTTLNFDDVKKREIVTNYWISDRASLSINKNDASVEISKNL